MADDEVELDELEHHLLEDNAQDDEVEDDVSGIFCSLSLVINYSVGFYNFDFNVEKKLMTPGTR